MVRSQPKKPMIQDNQCEVDNVIQNSLKKASKKIDKKMIKLCFTANSGGHLNQLLQLDEFAKRYTYFFITDRSAFSEELAQRKKVFFVEKFIIKECISKLDFLKPIRNLWQSFLIIKNERPDIIVTTGAGTAFGSCIMGRLFRKKIIFIESPAANP